MPFYFFNPLPQPQPPPPQPPPPRFMLVAGHVIMEGIEYFRIWFGMGMGMEDEDEDEDENEEWWRIGDESSDEKSDDDDDYRMGKCLQGFCLQKVGLDGSKGGIRVMMRERERERRKAKGGRERERERED